jgi:hypothetical protein
VKKLNVRDFFTFLLSFDYSLTSIEMLQESQTSEVRNDPRFRYVTPADWYYQILSIKSHLLGMEEELQKLSKREGSTVRI